MEPLIRIASRRQAQRRAAQASTLHPVAHSPDSVVPRTDLSPWFAPRDNLLSHPGIEGEPGELRRLRPQQASAAARDNPLLIQSNQGIRNIAKCTGNRLLVIRHHLLFDFLGKLQLSAKLSAFEEGLGQGSDAVDRLPAGSMMMERLSPPTPPEALIERLGKNCARATPICAFAAMRVASACSISGLRSSNWEGSPVGSSCGGGASAFGSQLRRDCHRSGFFGEARLARSSRW
jgi:hypothetical protein